MKRFIAVLVLAASLFGSSWATDSKPQDQADVARYAAILSILHKKAKKALVNAAQDKAFTDYFEAHDHSHKAALKERIDAISLNVQRDFQVEEMCLIDPNGAKLSRIVGDKIAYDLSLEEASALFFKPGFAKRPRTVHVSPIYMSPDADKWVVAFVTPTTVKGDKRAILHYEHGLDVYQRTLSKAASKSVPSNGKLQFAVTEAGWVVWQLSNNIDVIKIFDHELPEKYFNRFQLGGYDLPGTIAALDNAALVSDNQGNQYRGAYKKVADWYLISLSKINTDVLASNELAL